MYGVAQKMETETKDSNYVNGKKDDEIRKEKVDYDKLLSSAGELGLYQILLFLSTGPFYIIGAFAYFGQLFITEVSPNHWCWVPELGNLTPTQRKSLAIPGAAESPVGYSKCTVYVANWSQVLASGDQPDASWPTARCSHGWEFNTTEIPYPTISSEMGWVCDQDSNQATAQSIFFVGSIVGGFLVGWVADRFGRLPGAAFANAIGCVAGVITIFVTNFTQFAVCRFFMGMSYDNCFMLTYILLLEYVAPKYRAMAANLPFAVFFTFGLCILPWISLACKHWKMISLVTSVPMALALLAPFILPESPRWLLSRGRIDETVQRIIAVGRLNKKPVPNELIEDFKRHAKTEESQSGQSGSMLDIMKRPLLRMMFIRICFLYMGEMIVFDALVRSVGSLNFDFFLSFTIVSLTEFPSILLVSFILDWTGRKWLTLVTLLISGIFSVLLVFVGSGLQSVICAVVARFACNMACNTGMQWGAEMLPTPVRGSGFAIIHICGYVGTVISPFIVYLYTVIDWLPMAVVGAVAFLGVAVSVGLPETAHKQMPQTLDDAEALILSSPLLEIPCSRTSTVDSGHVNDSFELN